MFSSVCRVLTLSRSPIGVLGLVSLLGMYASPVRGADPFRERVQPLVKMFCVECHNATRSEGELDLTKYTSAAALSADYRQWEHVVTFVQKEEMPPRKAKQPTAAQRKELMAAVEEVLSSEARRLAGDPGVVLPRRLSNAEYNYTIRDLTGFDLRPTDSFPVDPASGEGFNNTGEALAMSPNLFKKYYASAQHVADHILITPSGLRFAPHPVVTFADQKKYYEQQILSFYDRHKVSYETYLTAAWQYRYRPAAKKGMSVEQWATEQKLSPRYLRALSDTLNATSSDDTLYLRWLRARWQAIAPPENATHAANATNATNGANGANGAGSVDSRQVPQPGAEQLRALRTLAQDIQKLSLQLCPVETQAIVGNAGNGPVQHIDRRKKTAAARDTFNTALVQDRRRLSQEFRNLPGKTSLKLVLQTAAVGEEQLEGYIVLSGMNFSTQPPNNYNPTSSQKHFSLKALLEDHAPEQAKKLKWGGHPRGENGARGENGVRGQNVAAEALVLPVPAVLELEIPVTAFPQAKEIFFYVEAGFDCQHSKLGQARVQLLDRLPGKNESLDLVLPLVNPDHPAAKAFVASAEAYCRLFPNRFYYVDDTRGLSAGFHLIEGFFRDDQPLCRSVLTDTQNQELNRLWDELTFGTQITEKMLRGFVFFERSERNFMKHKDFDPIKEEDPDLVRHENLVKFEEIYLARSGVPAGADVSQHPIHLFFEEIRTGLKWRPAQLKQAEPVYLKTLQTWAQAAYRRPLTARETQQLVEFYQSVSGQEEYGPEQAVRMSLVRLLVSPHFCYRADPAPPGDSVQRLPDLALASRLSYFLWSSMPDAELLSLAQAGKLHDEATLRAQTRRMLQDPKVQGFAQEFFGQWLGYRDFLQQEAVNRMVFPTFDDGLKQAMFEEPTRLATHLIQNDLPVTDLLSTDVTFVNKKLAQHYGVPFAGADGEWVLTPGMQRHGRGGLLGMAVFLTKNSQPQRTSPVKRGFWVVHKVLGEHIPAPPADVAVLPAKETDTDGKTIRQLLVQHTEDMKCARCHVRFDPVGLSMEGFDPIGRTRLKDLAGRSIDNVVHLPDGSEAKGVPEFARYLAAQRKHEFRRTLCRKFLGYALGRSLQLSDQVLLEKMQTALEQNDDRFVSLFETVIMSPQFRTQRCRDFKTAAFAPSLRRE